MARKLESEHQVLRQIFEPIWDRKVDGWRRPSSLSFVLKSSIKWVLAMPEWRPPSPETLSEFLKEHVSIDEVKGTPFYEITMVHQDPEFARSMLVWSDAILDKLLRSETYHRVAAQISYLEGRMKNVKETEVRQTLADLLVEQEKVKMMLDIDLPFAADVIEPPTVNSRPIYPKPLLAIVVAWILSVLAFSGVVRLREGRPTR